MTIRRMVDVLISDRLVMAIIVVNTLALFLHELAARGTALRQLWYWLDYACVVYFLVEASVKIGRFRWPAYWSVPWNRFDLTVVVLSLPALLGPVADLQDFAFILVLRLGRLFRLFRVLRFIPNVDHLADGIRRALRASVGVFLALLLIIFILAMGATLLFKEVDPERFGNPVLSSYSIFQVFTVEGWYEVPERLVEMSADNETVGNHTAFNVGARLFFVVAVVIGGILGLSLANAVFVDEMMMDNTHALERKVDDLTAELRELRADLLAARDGPSGTDPRSTA